MVDDGNKSKGGVQAVHLAAMIGNLDILNILKDKYKADFSSKTLKGLSPLHCASQRLQGIVSIYFLKDNCPDFDPNVADKQGASPLHYAIMSIEENNI